MNIRKKPATGREREKCFLNHWRGGNQTEKQNKQPALKQTKKPYTSKTQKRELFSDIFPSFSVPQASQLRKISFIS